MRRDRGECDAVQFDILNFVLNDLFLETGCKEQEQDVRLHCYVRTRIVRTVVSHHHITTIDVAVETTNMHCIISQPVYFFSNGNPFPFFFKVPRSSDNLQQHAILLLNLPITTLQDEARSESRKSQRWHEARGNVELKEKRPDLARYAVQIIGDNERRRTCRVQGGVSW